MCTFFISPADVKIKNDYFLFYFLPRKASCSHTEGNYTLGQLHKHVV